MWDWGDNTVFNVLQIIPSNDAFNYSFTVVCVAGFIAVAIGLIIRQLSRS